MVDTRRGNRNPFQDDHGYRLTEDPFIDASNIEVTVKDGEVTLDGMVSSRGLKRRAEAHPEPPPSLMGLREAASDG